MALSTKDFPVGGRRAAHSEGGNVQVRLTKNMGLGHGRTGRAGEVVDLRDNVARDLIARCAALPVASESEPARTTSEPQANRRSTRGRRTRNPRK